MKRGITKILASLAVCLAAVGMSVMAHGAPSSAGNTVKLSIGKADTINLAKPAADVLVANPGVADVGSLRSNRLYVVGKAIGDTNVLVFDEEGNQLANISIQVRADQQTLRETVHEFFPNEHVDVRTVNDSIVLQGNVSTPAVANQVRDLVGRFVRTAGQSLVDLMKVQGEQQVMLKVKVIEAKRSLLREYGIETGLANTSNGRLNSGFATTGLHNPFTTAVPTAVGLAAVSEFGSGTLLLSQAGGFGPLQIDYEALETRGLVNTLAEPTLTAISGETAGFLAGGEFPVPASRDSSGNITVEFKQFGVALNFIPTVLASDRISLQLTSEVSERSDPDGVTFGGITIPGLAVRRAQTTVQMGSGGTIMIAGLLKANTTNALNGYPGLSSLPIIGNLFKSKSFQRGESELVFLVTPYIVEPYADKQAERVAAASPLPSEIVTTSHAVSLSDVHSHTSSTVPASAAVPTAIPSATPAGVPAPVPGVSPAMQLAPPSLRHSDASPVNPATQFAEQERVNVIWDAPVKPVVKVAAVKKAAPQPAKVAVAQPKPAPASKPVAVPKAVASVAAPHPAVSTLAKAETIALPARTVKKSVTLVKAAHADLPAAKAIAAPVQQAPQKKVAQESHPASVARTDKPVAHPAAAKPSVTAKLQAAAVKNGAVTGQNPLSASFVNNLKSVYGNKMPSTITSGPAVGYIVD